MTVETHMNVKHMWSSYQLLNYIKRISISNNTMISKGISNINYTIPEHSAHTRRIQDTDVLYARLDTSCLIMDFI